MSSSLINSLAKVYDPNPLQKSGARKLSLSSDKSQFLSSSSPAVNDPLRSVESRMDSLSSQMERLLNMQQTVLTRLDGLSLDVQGMGRDLALMRDEGFGSRRSSGAEAAYRELRVAVERTGEHVDCQGRRLETVEKIVEGTQQVISYIGEVVKSSRLVELFFKQPGRKGTRKVKDVKAKDEKDKAKVNLKGVKVQKKRKPLDGSDSSSLNEPALQEQVEKLNRQNTELSVSENQRADEQKSTGLILTAAQPSSTRSEEKRKSDGEKDEDDVFEDSESEEEKHLNREKIEKVLSEQVNLAKDDGKSVEDIPAQICNATLVSLDSSDDLGDAASCSKRRVTEEDLVKDDLKKSRVEDGNKVESSDETEQQASTSEQVKSETEEATTEEHADETKFNIDFSAPPSAPFDHRIVTPKPHQIATYYTINKDEVLGGGRFGQVHKCIENSSGLTLAAKIIKARSQKEKEVVRNEIQVMNQLNHANLIQLYAAFESRHDIILVMEYVEGGELFDRIIDENYNLTELDTVLFIRQICEGLQYMHKMYILHLDLKPENILCVSRVTNKIKIIDFGLARRYKPREKLKVNFGTPEFLAPEVINYEFVSFPTDMWSLGVITYMLLSGLSPFLGDDDNETLNNILACQWNFEEEEFTDVSDEAKDFITRLLVKSKSWRMSATESLKHAWLSDHELHYKLDQKKNKCHSTHAPPSKS